MKTIKLNWSKLTSREYIFSIKQGLSGVYIWGFYQNDFVPYMVGKATGSQTYSDIQSRLWIHVSHLLSGEYAIHKKENLKQFYLYKPKAKWHDLAHIIQGQESFNFFINERCGKLKAHIDEMVNNFCFTFAEAQENQVADLEKSVIDIIGIKKLWNVRGGIPKEFKADKNDLGNTLRLGNLC